MKHRFPPDCPKSLHELIGRKVKASRALSNSFMTIPTGAVLTVRFSNRWEQINLTGPACSCCGIAPNIGGVRISDLVMVKDADLLTSAA